MSDALPGEHLCIKHQGNHSHYAEENCTICRQAKALADLRARLAEAEEAREKAEAISQHTIMRYQRTQSELRAMTGACEINVQLRDAAIARAEKAERERDDYKACEDIAFAERDAATARAEKAEVPTIVYQIREVARKHGWAIGVHGSLMRDIDLIGVPWSAGRCNPDELVAFITAATAYEMRGGPLSPRRHPGGRRSVLLMTPDATWAEGPDKKGWWTPKCVDLSLVCVTDEELEIPAQRDAAVARAEKAEKELAQWRQRSDLVDALHSGQRHHQEQCLRVYEAAKSAGLCHGFGACGGGDPTFAAIVERVLQAITNAISARAENARLVRLLEVLHAALVDRVPPDADERDGLVKHIEAAIAAAQASA